MSFECTRFAPSPTGNLHLGHALAAMVACDEAYRSGGRAYLRIEDIDGTRAREEYVRSLYEDLAWLGLTFEKEILVQSERIPLYQKALEALKDLEVVYPCFCTRKEVAEEWARMSTAPQEGDGSEQGESLAHYIGKCRTLTSSQREERIGLGCPHNWRLDCVRAEKLVGWVPWIDRVHGEFVCAPSRLGDVILARKDAPTSYHLAVTVDDALQGITLVTRGEDLLPVTGLHRTLQALLGYDVPEWLHHPLVRDAQGKRLAKRDHATSLKELRNQGLNPEDIVYLLEEKTGWSFSDLISAFR